MWLLGLCSDGSSSSYNSRSGGCLGNYCWESQEQLERDACIARGGPGCKKYVDEYNRGER